jgi:hypothetical protein
MRRVLNWLGLVAEGLGIAVLVAMVAFLVGAAVIAGWVLLDDPEPTNPASLIELHHGGTRVEECLTLTKTEHGWVWICGFFLTSPGLRQVLREAEPTDGAAAARIGCFLGSQGDSDSPSALGFAAPDRLTYRQRCREEIDAVRRLPRPIESG